MFSKPTTMINLVASVVRGTSSRRLALALAIVFLGSTCDLPAQDYEFLTVSGNGIGGDLAFSQFDSQCNNGFIRVSHHFSPGGQGLQDNLNALISPSAFPNVFPNSGNQIQGHLAQTLYGATSLVTFGLSGYNLKPTTVFGMWNSTTEANQPQYRIELLVNNNAVVPTFNQIGTDDNTGAAGVPGENQMVFNSITGEISYGAQINGGNGTHTNALFWDNIPAGTTEIRVYGNLQPPVSGNPYGDGVGYYFAEICIPEPTSFVLCALGLFSLGMFGRGRKR
jgi:hypothetical protein